MANTVSLVSVFLRAMDQAYKLESKTAMLDAITRAPSFLNANEVKVMKLSMVGLGTYSRTGGYPVGDLTDGAVDHFLRKVDDPVEPRLKIGQSPDFSIDQRTVIEPLQRGIVELPVRTLEGISMIHHLCDEA